MGLVAEERSQEGVGCRGKVQEVGLPKVGCLQKWFAQGIGSFLVVEGFMKGSMGAPWRLYGCLAGFRDGLGGILTASRSAICSPDLYPNILPNVGHPAEESEAWSGEKASCPP